MRMLHLLLVASLFAVINFSCKEDVEDVKVENNFPGYYRIVSIESSLPVDLNNDGIKTIRVLDEISGNYNFRGKLIANMYNPAFPANFAEVRPLKGQTNDALLIDFNYPFQNLLGEDEGEPVLSSYSGRFRGYSYRLEPDNRIGIIDNNPEYHAKYGKINSVHRIDEESFQVDLTLKVYDFKDKDWVEVREIVKYAKVPEYSE